MTPQEDNMWWDRGVEQVFQPQITQSKTLHYWLSFVIFESQSKIIVIKIFC